MNEHQPDRPTDDETVDKKTNKPNLLQVVASTLAAFIGVQSSKNRERDFKHGSITTYIIAGVVFTALFVTSVVMLVKLVLRSAGM